jgi:glucosamine-6-phosphate deaminase
MATVIKRTQVRIAGDKEEMGREAAIQAADALASAIEARGEAAVIFATGASQFEMLDSLMGQPVPWERVTAFHLDEYVGLSADHGASFRRYLRERVESRVTLKTFHYLEADRDDPGAVCQEMSDFISEATIDVALVGVGENGHLAFNDPPADFNANEPYLVVALDEACRRQQVGEGWFDSIEQVPKEAISMSVPEIMRARTIICTCPDERKAAAVKGALEGPVTPEVPASILRTHGDCRFFLDRASAGQLEYY